MWALVTRTSRGVRYECEREGSHRVGPLRNPQKIRSVIGRQENYEYQGDFIGRSTSAGQ